MLNRTIQTSVSLPVSMYVEFKERAERERRSMSAVIREIIQRGLDRDRDDNGQQQENEK